MDGQGHPRKWRSQLMGNILQERPLGAEALFYSFRHRVERGGHLADFVLTRRYDAHFHLATAESAQSIAYAAQRKYQIKKRKHQETRCDDDADCKISPCGRPSFVRCSEDREPIGSVV